MHELLALASCFVAPVCGAALLHAVRAQLSRPSEGLVSDYNLGIFLLAAEVRPLRHLLALVQARTLHLQRVVAANPHLGPSATTTSSAPHASLPPSELRTRLDALEAALAARPTTAPAAPSAVAALLASPELTAAPPFVAAVRRAVQPELDALTRAVRRYEKRAAVLSAQTESRLRELEARGRDALALAAAAERRGAQKGAVGVLAEWVGRGVWAGVVQPVRAAGGAVVWVGGLPGRALQGVLGVVGWGGAWRWRGKGKDGREVNGNGAVGGRPEAVRRKKKVGTGKDVAT